MEDKLYLERAPAPEGRPRPTQDLISLYGLKDLAASVARQDPETGEKRKLRKSYKGHIMLLPGKHGVPDAGETPWGLVPLALQPFVGKLDSKLRVNDEVLKQITFERSQAGVPGFDAKLLAAPGVQSTAAAVPVISQSSSNSPGGRKRSSSGLAPQEKRRKL